MKQYILKSTLVAEIRKRLLPVIRDKHYDEWEEGQDSERTAILDIINNLETKDLDDIIKNAEDHAYFAGSENTREKLINKACKWWEEELTYPSMTPEEIKWYKNKVRKFRKDMEDET